MSLETLSERYPQAVHTVREFFTMYYGAQIAQSEDAHEELVLFHVGTNAATVAVSADFLADLEPLEIREKLAAWNVAHLSRTLERGARIVVTSEGAEEELDASRL